jgi:DNA helicase-2/ATP-dependent DNA helicase PcrA
MDMPMNSDYYISNIEQHFKVSAGPGAGKTHWLIGHIRNILANSTRLGKTRSIACLTYSNVAVDEIKKRLGTSVQQVEVSTIHSFLYKHIVKPYAFSVADEYDLNVSKMDGHDEEKHYKLQEWINSDYKGLNYISNKRDFAIECLKKQQWVFIDSDLRRQIVVRDSQDSAKEKFLKNKNYEKYLNYKKLYWKEGTLSHDDVLFFSYQIVKKCPFVLEVLRAKFPYFLIDEFQDTSPIQTAILKLLAEEETIVGVIGDSAQSIYSFQGADEKQFENFTLPNIQSYTMADNRRSTIQIINLLDHIRKDMPQNPCKDENGNDKVGDKPILFIGDREQALSKITKLISSFTVLARQNETVTSIEHQISGKKENLLKALKEEDKTSDRTRWIEACVKAVAFAKKNNFKDAIQELVRLYRREAVKSNTLIDEFIKYKWRKQALGKIQTLLSNFEGVSDKSILEFSNEYLAKSGIFKMEIAKITGNKSSHQKTFGNYVKGIEVKDNKGEYRTIHKAKGDEFENTVLILEDEKEVEFLINPDLSKEEHRIRYVAVSRAQKRLFICVPALKTVPQGIDCIDIESL